MLFLCTVEGTGGGGIIGPLRAGPEIDIRPVLGFTTDAGIGRFERPAPKRSPGGCIVDRLRKSPMAMKSIWMSKPREDESRVQVPRRVQSTRLSARAN